ncbi:MAG: PAS domain-containing protein, partial [Verrucomicrobiota bacterium]
YPELTADAQEVLRKLGFVEKPVNARDGRWFTVRIMPYRTLDDRIDGVVITFADITAAKTLEAQLREKHDILEKHVAEQSRKMEKPKDKVRVKTAGPKRRPADAGKRMPSGKI